jgi:hypothetical protein
LLAEDLIQEATTTFSATASAGFVTITMAAVSGKKSVVLGVDWLSDLAPTTAEPAVEFRGGAAGTTRKYGTGTTVGGSREFPRLVVSDAGIVSDIRLKVTTAGWLAVRYSYINAG